ncbi:SH3 and PX domain-containing protein 2A-like isoform X1 [Lytechinus variegatus]|uniref:SH3 and PX domain-containing protein 2A-like isoform X1 n=1 Tax=Lytechinus variegatus TaxID=7654 RepID=UPI001BB1DF72|nr:SH3 and PX domain-containing protein 2A-like isoform X1 [Lytechinus variegatus]
MGKRTVLNACVTDIEKRREPTKHYVYIIHVTWSDGSVNVVYRRYSSFFDFQNKLLSKFPEEAGANNPSSRCIPFLPGKKLFGRSHVREVALKRLAPIDEYCQALVKLPGKISDSKEVIDFFTPTPEDVSPPSPDGGESTRGKDIGSISEPIQAEQYIVVADYKKQQKNEVELTAGDLVEVFEKNDNGWWFVTVQDQHGWAPGTFLQKPDGQEEEEEEETLIPGNDESYITNNAYQGQAEDEISFETGVIVNIIQKSLDGWWKVSYQGKQGWAPATYLQIYKGPAGVTPKPPTQSIGNVMLLKGGSDSRPKPSPGPGRPQLPPVQPRDEPGQLYCNFDPEDKPTPPRRATVKDTDSDDEASIKSVLRRLRRTKSCGCEKSVRRGGVRQTKPRLKKVMEYYTTASFQGAAGEGSLSFDADQKLEVMEENDGGWWYAKINGEEGWVPSNYIEKREVTTSGRFNGKSLSNLDEETGEDRNVPPALPARPTFGSGGTGAFKPVTKKSIPPPVDRSNSPLLNRKPNTNSGRFDEVRRGSGGSGGDMMAALKKQFERSSVEESSSPPIPARPGLAPKLPKPTPQAFCNRDAAYITTSNYVNDENDGLSFEEGQKVEVIKKDDSGWWLVRIGATEGWAPNTFLEKL